MHVAAARRRVAVGRLFGLYLGCDPSENHCVKLSATEFIRLTPSKSGRVVLSLALMVAGACDASLPAQTAKAPSRESVDGQTQANSAGKAQSQPAAQRVGYDLRHLRPRDVELSAVIDKHRARAAREGKQLAILFAAEWCNACKTLDLELGNEHAASQIGDVRILKLVEEEWKTAVRLDEFNALRSRWVDQMWSYPLLVLIDGQGREIETMANAKLRLEAGEVEATLPNWFADLRSSGWQRPQAARAG